MKRKVKIPKDMLKSVTEFFKGDKEKVKMWFRLPNPSLGYQSPEDFISYGRVEMLSKLITNAIEDNKRAEAYQRK